MFARSLQADLAYAGPLMVLVIHLRLVVKYKTDSQTSFDLFHNRFRIAYDFWYTVEAGQCYPTTPVSALIIRQ
jgi:hypothetical protein